MLRSDLCDFSDAYIVVKGNVVSNFNNRKKLWCWYFPDESFPDGSTAAQINTARTAAKTAAANDANNNDTKKSYQRYFF